MKLPWFSSPSRQDQDLEEEIRTHLEMVEEEYRRRGMDPAAARQAARRSFGPIETMKEEHRQARPFYWLDPSIGSTRFDRTSVTACALWPIPRHSPPRRP